MKVQNMTSSRGNTIPNQFIITDEETYFLNGEESEPYQVEYFQSYNSIIAKKVYGLRHRIELDSRYWDYSVTTGKYRNQFLGETKAETQKKIDSGEYVLVDLN